MNALVSLSNLITENLLKSNNEFEKNLVAWSRAKKFPPGWLRNYYRFKGNKK